MTPARQCRVIILLLCLLAVAGPGRADPAQIDRPLGQPLVSVFDAKKLGRDTMTWCVVQDAAGKIYVGGDRLFVGDTERWQSYPMGNSYAIRSLDFGPDGKLWAAGFDELGWFERLAGGDWSFHSLRDQLPRGIDDLGDVWNVYATPTGAIFVTASRIIQWDGVAFKVTNYDVSRRLVSVRSNQSVYVYHRPSGLLRVDPAGPVIALSPDAVGPHAVFWIGEINQVTVYATSGGVGTLNNGKIQYPDPELSAYVRENILSSAQALPDGTLALGTLRGGIVLVGKNLTLQRTLGSQEGLSDKIYGLYVAHDKSLWATASAQVFRISGQAQITLFDKTNGLPLGGCLDFAIHQGQPLVLTAEGLLQLRAGPLNSGSLSPVGPDHGSYRDLESSGDTLLMGGNFGAYAFRQGRLTTLYKTPFDVFKIRPAGSPQLFNAAVGQRIVQFSTAGSAARELTTELPDVAEDFVRDEKGRLWIATGSKSLLVASPAMEGAVDAEPASRHHAFPATTGHARVAAFADTIVGINPEVACWLNPATDQFEPIAGYPTGNTLALSNPDAQDRVWIVLEGAQAGMPARLGQLIRTSTGVIWRPQAVEGLAQVGTPRALQVQTTNSGDVLWVAGSNALMRLGQPGLTTAQPLPMPLLRAVVRNDAGEVTNPGSGPLPYTTRRLQLQFSSTEFGRHDTLRYQTLLEGVDQAWSAPTHVAELELANLREGDYNFKVRLLADTGAVSASNNWHFRIAAPWWRTPYATVGLVGALGLILTGLFRLRIRNIRRRAETLEQTVRLRTAELEKANAAKTEFVASMSHEIRNPMNGIIGSAHALADTPLNPEQIEMVNTLRNCATFLSSLVEDVLDFSSIEAGVFTTQQLTFNPAEIIESVAAMLATHAIEAGAHFDLEIDPVLPARLIGDPSRIQQIVVNYATNALKFSGGGRVRLSVYTENNQVVYAVTDNGPGITTDEQSVLFTRFSRLKTARNAGVTGTGLGLAVCRAVAERMNGSVGVASSPDRGATFYLRLPLTRAGSETEILPAQNLPSLEGARALVVEDLAYNSRVLNAMLGKFGLSVDLTSNGTDALCKFAVNSYHVIFLDYDLPDMSGLEVARRMRALSTGPSRPLIVATTAYSTVQDRDACFKAGMDLFLSKPITPEKLQNALASLTHQMGPTLPAPSPESAGYNLQILTYLAGDTPGAIDREIKRFLDAVSDVHNEIRSALRTSDRGGLAKAAHRMLSHARMIEDKALSTLAAEIEIEAGYADLARLELLATDMAHAITRLRKMLVRHRAELSLA